VPVTPGSSVDFARALTLVRPLTRRRLYWTARAVFVSDSVHVEAFDAVFFSIFGSRAAVDELDLERCRPSPRRRTTGRGPTTHRRRATGADEVRRASLSSSPSGEQDEAEEQAEVEVPLALASVEEQLGHRSFDALAPHELAQLYRLMSRLELATPLRRTRRYERGRHGERIDMRRTLRASLRTGGIRSGSHAGTGASPAGGSCCCATSPARWSPMRAPIFSSWPALPAAARSAEAFVFATRLTRVTRALAARNPELAIQRAAAAAPDWSSGTRIGEALREFNDKHGRRGMARGAVVVILSDGWERGDPKLVGREMERLARLAHRIVWVNPRVGADDFSVRSGGMLAALPHCDALVSGHSFAALGEVVEAIGAESWDRVAPGSRGRGDRAVGQRHTGPGSSVGMPSGHGPSRGKTTPAG
jgi:uncharacterized protein with von Willebrand factor type A (vWA) domain